MPKGIKGRIMYVVCFIVVCSVNGSQVSILTLTFRAAAANFWQARLPQWWPHQGRAAVAAAAFYFAKSRQGLGLGGLASRGGPDIGAVDVVVVIDDEGTAVVVVVLEAVEAVEVER